MSDSTPTTPTTTGGDPQKKFAVRVRTNISKEPVTTKQNTAVKKPIQRRPSQPQPDNSPINSPTTPTTTNNTLPPVAPTTTSNDTPSPTLGHNRRDSFARKSLGSSLVGSPTERIIANALQQQKRSSLTSLGSSVVTVNRSETGSPILTSPEDELPTPTTTTTNINNTPVVPQATTNKRTIPISSIKKTIPKKEQTQEEIELSLSNFTLPMLPQDQHNDEEFVFYVQNPIFDDKSAVEPQILMTSEDIDTYNAVLKRIDSNNKDKNNHLVFEYEMASYLAHKHIVRKTTLTRRLSNGSMHPRPREKKPLDEIFHDEHDISKCSKNWRFQLRVFNENNGFIDPEYEIPASLITSSFKWKHEFMSQVLNV
jgi:hypothetical protein